MERSIKINWFSLLNAVLDICMIYSSILLAAIIFDSPVNARKVALILMDFPQIFGTMVLVFYLTGLYTSQRNQATRFILINVVISVLLQAFLSVAIFRWKDITGLSLSTLLLSVCIQVTTITLAHMCFRSIGQCFSHNKRVLIIEGETPFAQEFLEKSHSHRNLYKSIRILHSPDKYALIKELLEADLIVFGDHVYEKEILVRICLDYGKEILIQPGSYDLFIVHSQIRHIDDMLTLSVQPPRLKLLQRILKRTADLIGSLLILIITAPALLVLFVVIPLSSQGSAVYKQERSGMGGRIFQIYKFRSMISNAEQITGPVMAVEGDPRITKLGRWMRSVRIDELPQLFNVLKGEMSLIGPRPERPFFIEKFSDKNPDYLYRFAVKPGITGLAQVMGKYNSTAEQKLRFDILYVQNYSLWLDVKIVFRTIYTVLEKEQSAGIKQSLNEGHLKNEMGV